MILTIVLQRTCELGFSKIVGLKDTAQSTTTTKRGASKYMLCGIKDSMGPLSNIVIPDLQFRLNLGVSQIQFSLTDIKIANIIVADAAVDINGQDSQIALLNCSVTIQFQWQMQQQSYPFASDKGSGKIIVKNGQLNGVAGSSVDTDECPGHMIINIKQAKVSYESLNILLDGGDSWFFQSIINLLLAEIEEPLMNALSDILVKAFVKLVNNVFESNRQLFDYANHWESGIVKDERYTSGIQAGEGYISLLMTGYVYQRDNLKDDFVAPQMLNKVTYNKFNNDMQITIHESAINNAFYVFHKYENIYSGPTFQVLQAPRITFYNAAAVLTLQVKVNGSVININLLAELQHENNAGEQRAQVYFNFKTYEAELVDNINVEQVQAEVVSHMNSVIKFACYQLSYTHLTELNDYTHMLDPIEKVIRLIGPEEYECKGARQ
ncbi:Conserved_hypothetical protein [Hexamita inflata]|uniref:Uncharacterized protein n=1 Tax=Hexamita inflata TaxID=28002 RepID=A0AA86P6U8_9EUKA|nr:Conserved hypothetical protein [Hexamita inflata]